MAPSYKLLYFDFPGKAEPTRLLFAYGGIKYEDERFSYDDWPKYKSSKQYLQIFFNFYVNVMFVIIFVQVLLTKYFCRYTIWTSTSSVRGWGAHSPK